MSDILTGMEIADRLNRLSQRADAFDGYILAHAADEGAHAAAFAAHGLSPDAVEDAEQVAQAVIDSATETAAGAVDTIEQATGEALETIAEAAADAVETTEDVGETAVETPLEMINEGAGEHPAEEYTEEPVTEREPSRVHPLHRRVGLPGQHREAS